MATRTGQKVGEASDLDDDGDFDVQHYPLPDGSEIENKKLRAAWEEAVRLIQSGEMDDDSDDAVDDSPLAEPVSLSADTLLDRAIPQGVTLADDIRAKVRELTAKQLGDGDEP